jgi:arabinofuranosyltransferase
VPGDTAGDLTGDSRTRPDQRVAIVTDPGEEQGRAARDPARTTDPDGDAVHPAKEPSRADSASAGSRDDPPARARSSRRVRGAGQVLVLALPVAILIERGWSHRWVTDDGFINLRVARMILDGHGPVFNVSERVEATTSVLWVWSIVAGDVALPLRMEWVAVVLGLACAAGGLALAVAGSVKLHRLGGAAGLIVPAGALVVAALPPFWDYSTSGLEGGLVFGWLGLLTWLLARWAGRTSGLGPASAVVIGLAPLIRPDLALAVPVVLGGVLAAQWSQDGWGARLRTVGAAAALPVVYQVFRMGYYASVVPNTALAKSGGRTRWAVGVDYLRDLVQPYWLVLPLAFLLLAVLAPSVARAWSSRSARLVVAFAALPAAGLLHATYVTAIGGDYMHGRLLLPGLFAVVAPVATMPVLVRRHEPAGPDHAADADTGATGRTHPVRSLTRALPTAVAVVVGAWAVVCIAQLRWGPEPVVADLFSANAQQGHVELYGHHAVTTDDQRWGADSPLLRSIGTAAVDLEGPLDVTAPPGLRTPAHVGYGIGVTGYALGPQYHVIDLLGLADPVAARYEVDRRGATGHEKPMPAPWLAARLSTTPVDSDRIPSPAMIRPLYESPPGQFDGDTEAARQALACGALAELDETVRAPLAVGRFLENLVKAPRLTQLRVPPDPNVAQDRFCG